MSIDQKICEIVNQRWQELESTASVPSGLVFFKVQGKLSKNASIIALILDEKTQQPVAVAKIPRNPACTTAIDQELEAMHFIRNISSSWQGAGRAPFQGFIDDSIGSRFLIQKAMPGHSLVRDMDGNAATTRKLFLPVLQWLKDFHLSTSADTVLEGETLNKLINEPVNRFVTEFGGDGLPPSVKAYLESLEKKVQGLKLKLVSKHGDFNAHNIIVSNDGRETFSVIDWEDYRANQLPVHDLNHFFISNSKLQDMTLDAAAAFDKYMLDDGWYKDLYFESVGAYQDKGIIERSDFCLLTPLYMIDICFNLISEQRQQGNTVNTWLNRMDGYISSFLS